jgi:hypothetical protein
VNAAQKRRDSKGSPFLYEFCLICLGGNGVGLSERWGRKQGEGGSPIFFENFFLPRNWYSIARKKRVYIRIEKDSICLTGGFPFYVKTQIVY